MALYQLIFLDEQGASPALDIIECGDDAVATRVAMDRLKLHSTCRAVEVFEDERLAVRLERADPIGPDADWRVVLRRKPAIGKRGQRHLP